MRKTDDTGHIMYFLPFAHAITLVSWRPETYTNNKNIIDTMQEVTLELAQLWRELCVFIHERQEQKKAFEHLRKSYSKSMLASAKEWASLDQSFIWITSLRIIIGKKWHPHGTPAVTDHAQWQVVACLWNCAGANLKNTNEASKANCMVRVCRFCIVKSEI